MDSGSPQRFVLDANTIVSGYLFPASNPGRALEFVLTKHRLLLTLEVAFEIAGVVRRPKFDRYLSQRRREELLASTIRDSEFIAPTSAILVCRDADDNKYLDLAVDGMASAIVSGDADQLVLHPFRGIPVLTPRDFIAQFTGQS